MIALFTAPATVREAEVAFDAGSFGLRQGRVSLSLPMQEGFDLRADLTRFEIDGFRPQSAADRTLGNVRLGWRGDADTVTVLVSDFQQDAQDPLGLTRAQFDADPYQTTPQAIAVQHAQVGQPECRAASTGGIVSAPSRDWSRRSSPPTSAARGVTQFLAIPAATQSATQPRRRRDRLRS